MFSVNSKRTSSDAGSPQRIVATGRRVLVGIGFGILCASSVAQAQTTIVRGNELQLFEPSASRSVSLVAPTGLTNTYSLTLPTNAPGQGALLYTSTPGGASAWTGTPSAGQLLVAQGAGLVPTWVDASSILNSNVWSTAGNAGTTASTFLGTTDAQPLMLRTNNSERMRIDASGNVGIGTGSTSLSEKLTVANGNLMLSNTGTQGEIRFAEASSNGSNYAGIRASSAMGANYTITLPASAPSAGAVLRANSGTPSNLEWSDLNVPRVVFKQADEAVTVIAGLLAAPEIDDADLAVDVAANSTYVFDMYLKVNKNGLANLGDFTCEFNAIANADISFGYSSSGAAIQNSVVNALGVNTGAIGVTALANQITYVQVKGVLRTGNNGGTLQFRWGLTALLGLGASVSVLEDSYMTITRVQ